MTIRSTVFSTVTLALGGVLLTGCGVGEASVPDTAALEAAMPVPVETTKPLRLDIYATYDASATISSDSDAPVVARVAGEVVELVVEESDRVEAGAQCRNFVVEPGVEVGRGADRRQGAQVARRLGR